jgi:hypothetical protein
MKVETDPAILTPFTEELDGLRASVDRGQFCIQVGLFCAVLIAFIIVSLALLNLVVSFKTAIMRAR